jgi:hypothetical protein
MQPVRHRKVMLGVAVALMVLTLFAAAQTKATSIGFPFPWQYYPDTGRTPVDYRIVGADALILLVCYYGTIRGFMLMILSPHRLPFSRKRAYGDDRRREDERGSPSPPQGSG